MGLNIPVGRYGNEIQLQPKDESSSDKQKWVRGPDVGNGWFSLTNPNSGKNLSAINEASLVATGKYTLRPVNVATEGSTQVAPMCAS